VSIQGTAVVTGMGKLHAALDADLQSWLAAQRVFFVGSCRPGITSQRCANGLASRSGMRSPCPQRAPCSRCR